MGLMSYRPLYHSSHASHLSPTSHSLTAPSSDLRPLTSDLRPPSSGSALIIAIWTVALLSVLVLSFSFDAILEGRIGTFVRHRQRVNYLTQSGVAIAEMLLEKQLKVSPTSLTTAEEDRWKVPALQIKQGQTAVIDESLGDGIIHIEISPEQSRWNINKLCKSAQEGAARTTASGQPPGQSDLVWEQIFRRTRVPDEMFEDLIDCWNDWTDADRTISGRNGAEDEYYQQETDPKTREPRIPYMTRNGPIDTISELLRVKGFREAIAKSYFLHSEERPSEERPPVQRTFPFDINKLFTTYGDGKINVNSASLEVLMTIPDMDDKTAEDIINEQNLMKGTLLTKSVAISSDVRIATTGVSEEEENFYFKSVDDFKSRFPGISTTILQYVTVNSSVFRLNIEGRSAGISHRIEAIAELNGDKVRYLRWREDP